MENIIVAKNSLFDSLKNYAEVVGASVRSSNGNKYIVILLSRNNRRIIKKIPGDYMGAKVTHEIIGKINA